MNHTRGGFGTEGRGAIEFLDAQGNVVHMRALDAAAR
ncbi:hypothetical protein SAMN04487782_0188 [Stenotrophomonas maltophilia]|nr:hypothetical protein SAMN04487782_0188 [Stenotrophomonas maltophilia]